MKAASRQPGIAVYLRVSSDDKQHPDASFEYQRQRIQEAIDRSELDLPLTTEYTDILSGKNNNRPGLQRMLTDARKGLFTHLVVYSIDRIGRKTQDTLTIIDELTNLNVQIMAADSPNIDFDTPNGNLFIRMRVVIGQYEVDLMRQRVIDTKKSMVNSGKWAAGLPDGYRRKKQ